MDFTLYCKPFATQAKEWMNLFLSLEAKCERFQKKNVAPYMHCLVYHVPQMVAKYGNIKQFSGQGMNSLRALNTHIHYLQGYNFPFVGVEKNNDVARRNYFSSNLHDPAGEILKAECRLENTESHKRQKRKYTKKDNDYWVNGGIREKRMKLVEIQNHNTSTN